MLEVKRAVLSAICAVLITRTVLSVEVPKNIQSHLEESCRNLCQNNVPMSTDCKCDKEGWSLIQNKSPRLLCRLDDSLILKIEEDFGSNHSEYLIEKTNTSTENWTLIDKCDSNIITINSLEQNSSNKFRIWSVTNAGVVYLQETEWLQTFADNYLPGPISNLKLDGYNNDGNNFDAILSWEISKDLPCNYEITWLGPDSYSEKELQNPEMLNTTKITNLKFEAEYSVSVVTKDSQWFLESEKEWLNFTTPSCLKVFDNNISICAPPVPTGLQVQVYINRDNSSRCDVILTWDTPLIMPELYEASLLIFSPMETNLFKNITGEANTTTFEDLDLDIDFEVYLVAVSQGGRSSPLYFHQKFLSRLNYSENIFNVKIVISIAASTIISFIIILLVCFYKKKREKMVERNYFKDIDVKANLYPLDKEINIIESSDEWEIEAKNLKVDSFLGKGAFGIVRKGWLTKDLDQIEVAVKMLREDVTGEEILQFKQEIDILKSVGTHPHVVSLIGCCTCVKYPRDLRLVVEYCSKGDLQTYLRNISDKIRNCCSEELNNVEAEENYINEGINFSNKAYLMQADTNAEAIQVKDLLSIARQIALGMEYLSNMKVVHRDLAARNVLVCENNTVKVSDFGLSRDVYKYNVYYKTGGGKLPIKWMAIESLTHQRYTTESDVWSYGILLWEIFSLGGSPYPNIEDMGDFLFKLKTGYRMECPTNCSNEVYSLMRCCWKTNPKHRPSFNTVAKVMGILLESSSDYINLDLAVTGMHEINEIKLKARTQSISSDRYVKPKKQFS